MVNLIGVDAAKEIRERYKLGTTKKGEVIFWMIDINGNIRQPKAMTYNQEGNRIDKPYVPTGYSRDHGYSPCIFGEHLLKDNTKPVALVESEKTACLGSFGFPQFTWVASGGVNGLTRGKAEVLRGSKVLILYDADTQGREGAESAHTLLEKLGIPSLVKDLFQDRNDHYDIADYIAESQQPKSESVLGPDLGVSIPQVIEPEQNHNFYFGKNGFLREELNKGQLIAV